MKARPFAIAVAASTVTFLLVASLFHLAAGAFVYMPELSTWRLLRYGIGLHGQDFLVLAVTLGVLHSATALWPRARWLIPSALAVAVVLRLLHYDALKQSGELLSAEAVRHTDLAYLFFTAPILAKYLVAATLLGALAWLLHRLFANAGGAPRPRLFIALASSLAVIATWGSCAASLDAGHVADWPVLHAIDLRSPEVAAFTAVTEALSTPEAPPAVDLSASDIAALHGFGLDVDPAAPLPLRRQHAYDAPLPRRPGQLDVVVIFFEGFSDRLLGREWQGTRVTPHLDRFAAEHLRATAYYNHTTPTVLGLQGQLCSFYPVGDHESWLEAHGQKRAGVRCLPHVLAEHGFSTTYLGHGNPRFARLGDMLGATGFQRLLFGQDVAEQVLGIPSKARDRTDQEMLEATWRLLAEPSDRPRFVAVSTMDFHIPFTPKTPGPLPAPLQILHETDAAFGALVARLDSTRTLLIVTADHAALPSSDVVAIVGTDPDYQRSPFDRVTFLLHSPVHELPHTVTRLASTVDLAPTLLHLLDLDAATPWMGLSLFDARERPTGILGTHARHHWLMTTEPRQAYDLDATEAPHEALYRRWFDWQAQLVATDRVWRD